MRAIGSFVVVEIQHEEVKTKGGILLTEANETNMRYKLARVVSAGEDVKDLSSGDMIYYDFAGGSDIRIDGKKYVVVHDRQVVVKL
jgi:chaperonin GroES